jgi:hypothetical protein
MIRKEICSTCKQHVERKDVIQRSDHKEIVLTCGHVYRLLERDSNDSVPVSDSVTSRVISFESEQDRVSGFYELLLSKSQFKGIDKNKFVLTNEQVKIPLAAFYL